MAGVTEKLAVFASDLEYEDLPAAVIERTKMLILDITGITVRARHDVESTASLIRAVSRLELTGGSCSVLGDSATYTPPAAALINGTLAHSLDFDDTHAEGSLHSSAPILPAALAAAEISSASGRDLITAVVAGFEIQIRLSMALNPAEHYERGFHPTATCGIFGAAAATSKLLGLGAADVQSAFGIALSQAAGSMEFLADGAWTKRSHVGQAAQNGLMCAFMAGEGFKGVKDAFEGRRGFFNSYAPNSVPDKAVADLGETWETLRLALKPYPSCRYSHAAMQALITIREEHSLDWSDIEEVDIGLPEAGWNLIGDPLKDKRQPKSVVDGQFSMPFCAAVVLREGNMYWDDYKKHLDDHDTLALCRKINVTVDPRAQAEFPANLAGLARVKSNGQSFEKFVSIPKGEPDNFMSQEEIRAKFDGLCQPYLGEQGSNKLAGAILALEEANSVSTFMALSRS